MTRIPRVGWIYAIAGGSLVKFGFSDNVKRRLKTLQIGSPVKLVLLGKWRGHMDEERAVHRRFDFLRCHGEWFRRDRAIDRYVAQKAKARLAPPSTTGTELASLVAEALEGGTSPDWRERADLALRRLPVDVKTRVGKLPGLINRVHDGG